MKVLVVGGGGREHALAWKIAQSPKVEKVYCAPGNAGISDITECIPYKADNIIGLANFAYKEKIDLTVVGPEDPLAAGIVDLFDGRQLMVVGPTKKAAQLESSKAFAKNLMKKNNIPTADYGVFDNIKSANGFLHDNWSDSRQWVVKASGLAKGKGVIMCNSMREAYKAVDRVMLQKEFGPAGDSVVIEEMLYGPEASIIGLSDKSATLFFPPAQDYKPINDGDKGPNTGGMGSYSPVPAVTDEIRHEIEQEAVLPTMRAMKKEGMPLKGTVYAALMLTADGPKILEYNVRFGDPEAQPLFMRMESDLVPYLEACAEDRLEEMPEMEFDMHAVCVVLASGGYPGPYEKGKPITGLKDVADFSEDVFVFHAGTKKEGGKIYTNGGRVLGVTALGRTLDIAADLAYEAAGMIEFEGKYFRTDIGRNVLERGRV